MMRVYIPKIIGIVLKLDVVQRKSTFGLVSSSDFQAGKGFGKFCCLPFGMDTFWMFFHLRPTIKYFLASSSDFQGRKGFGKSCCLPFGMDKFWMFFT